MHDTRQLGPLKIGIIIPAGDPTEGGGFELQQTIFAEIIRRTANFNDKTRHIQYIPVATHSQKIENWQLNPNDVINVEPAGLFRLRSSAHRRIFRLFRKLEWSETLAGRKGIELLGNRIHALWSLNSGILTDQFPFIITVWDLQHRLQPFFPEVSSFGAWEIRQKYYSTIARKAFLAVVGTERGALEIEQFFGSDQSRILVNPFPCPPLLDVSKKDQESVLISMNLRFQQYIIYPAQFWPHKNHLAILLALQELASEGHALKIVFTGSDKGAYKAIAAHAQRLGISQLCLNAGFVTRTTLASLYRNSLALVYPSFFGPDNIPPLEAMSYGTPAIVADVPGSREQFGNSVLRFSPHQPQQIVDCLLRLQSEAGLRDLLIQRGRQLIGILTPAAYVDCLEEKLTEYALALHSASLIR